MSSDNIGLYDKKTVEISDIPKRIKNIIKALNLTQTGLASKMGVSQGVISEFASGAREPSKEFLIGLSKLGISLDWFLTGKVEMFLDESIARFDEKTHQARLDSEIFKIPLLSREDAMRFVPDTDIPSGERKANSGEYPITSMVTIPFRVMEYGTDLRAIAVFDSRMAPTLKSGDIAVIEATGWNSNGIYLYRMGDGLHISYVVSENGRYKFENEMKKEIVYDADTFKVIGRVRAVVRDMLGYDKKGVNEENVREN